MVCKPPWWRSPARGPPPTIDVYPVSLSRLPRNVHWISPGGGGGGAGSAHAKTVLHWKFHPPNEGCTGIEGYEGMLTGHKGVAVEANVRLARDEDGVWEVQALVITEYARLARVVEKVTVEADHTHYTETPSGSDISCEVSCRLANVPVCTTHRQHYLRVVVHFRAPSKKIVQLAGLWRADRGQNAREVTGVRALHTRVTQQRVPWVGAPARGGVPWRPPRLGAATKSSTSYLAASTIAPPQAAAILAAITAGAAVCVHRAPLQQPHHTPTSPAFSLPDLFGSDAGDGGGGSATAGAAVGAGAATSSPSATPHSPGTATRAVVVVDGGVRACSYTHCERVRGFAPGDRVCVRDHVRSPWVCGTVRALDGQQPLVAVGPTSSAPTSAGLMATAAATSAPSLVAPAQVRVFQLVEPDRLPPSRLGSELRVGSRVRVRDTTEGVWQYGLVMEVRGACPAVVLDGESTAFTWAFIEAEERTSQPPPTFHVGDRVRVRDNELESWMFGHVVALNPDASTVVALDGQTLAPSSSTGGHGGDIWRYCEHWAGSARTASSSQLAHMASKAAQLDAQQGQWVPVVQNPSALRCGSGRMGVAAETVGTPRYNEPLEELAASSSSTEPPEQIKSGSRVRVRNHVDDAWLYGTVITPPATVKPVGAPVQALQAAASSSAHVDSGVAPCSPPTPAGTADADAGGVDIDASGWHVDVPAMIERPVASSSCAPPPLPGRGFDSDASEASQASRAPPACIDMDAICIAMQDGTEDQDDPLDFSDDGDADADADGDDDGDCDGDDDAASTTRWTLPPPDGGASRRQGPPPPLSVVVQTEPTLLSVLPERVVVMICASLDKRSLLEFSRTGRRIHELTCGDRVWKPYFWEDASRGGCLTCLPSVVRDEATEALIDSYVTIPSDLRTTYLLCRKQKLEEREQRLKKEQRRHQRLRMRRGLERGAPEIISPLAVLVLTTLLALAVHALLAETGTMAFPYGTGSRGAHLANACTGAVSAILGYVVLYMYFISNYENPVFLLQLTEWAGIAGTGLLMLHKAVRRDVSYSWNDTCRPLIVGIATTFALLFIIIITRLINREYYYIRTRLPSFMAIVLVPLPIIVTMFQAGARLGGDSPDCTAIFWPLLLFIGVMLPWPPCIFLIACVFRCTGRGHQRFSVWMRKTVCPSLCTYLLYCFICAFFAGMMEGVCFAPQLGLTLLVIFLTILSIVGFIMWERAIYGG